MNRPVRAVLAQVARTLSDAGLATPRADAELLAAHVLGVARTRLPLVDAVPADAVAVLTELANRRAGRVPLQHLTGRTAMGGITVEVGPGVFVPRPETELLLAWGLAELAGVRAPVVVDLCTGSGVLALAVAGARPDAVVHAVERDAEALAWAGRNARHRSAAGDTPIQVHAGDVAEPELLADLAGRVDLVLCNPPYVPAGTPVPPEVADHDPPAAVFAGPEGLDVIRPVAGCAARLLAPGGRLAIEHDDGHHVAVPELLAAQGVFLDVTDHSDLAGRPRYATARKVGSRPAQSSPPPAS